MSSFIGVKGDFQIFYLLSTGMKESNKPEKYPCNN